ncbi:MAG: 16S rRNA (uracil(1498)-N(3))-methyltransferase [Halioglobus sp.]
MNILLFDASDRIDELRIRVDDDRLKHLVAVHRSAVGDTLRVGEIDGRIGKATIEALGPEEAVLRVELQREPPPKLPIIVLLALPRPKMLRRILRSVAEFGVSELHLINSARVEKSFWQSPLLQQESIRNYLLQGLEQAGDTRLPAVHQHKRFKPWIEDEFPALAAGKSLLLAHPGNHPPCPSTLQADTLLAIGPEGGFVPYEVEQFEKAGCEIVSLGPRILRVENAVSALLGRFI